ncbi:unnamed protein product [Triticum turgidum subsp. durum]|uniref:Uncharacterized protein n=1 Tax=Triticum turgidum subsp. durum TaxID=4567 RepID=A0A9R0RF13_TRITD|nr:unnamed protein product [Triticum turgidum subsp. durum]
MMDSYEECRDPPRLYLLDKFDNAGAGACLKRYSDPSYFKKSWDVMRADKTSHLQKERRSHKIKVLFLVFYVQRSMSMHSYFSQHTCMTDFKSIYLCCLLQSTL